jgi:integrase
MDLFKLSFYLIGINIIDLLHLNNIYKGRVEYNRAKTKRLYSIKVEPEAMAIIEKYRGKDYLLSYMDTNVTYRTVYKHLQKTLAESKDMFGVDELTTYWARHTWATIASELDIPKDTIAAALGHGGNSVTDIYINFDIKKVDEANRKVLDYVLYDKK